MKERWWSGPLAGALLGIVDAGWQLATSRTWIPAPSALLAVGALAGLLLGAPSALLGRRGPLGAALTLLAAELALRVLTDPPPFQEAPWYVHSPLALGLGAAALAGLGAAGWRWPAATALPLSLAAALGALRAPPALPSPSAAAHGPSVVLVTLDTTRADHLSAYGYERIRTPAFDGLAAQGALFTRAMSQIAVTNPSHTSIMTGSGTWSHAVLLNGVPVPPERALLAEAMRDQGYATAAFVSAYVLDGDYGLSRGFAVYDDDFGRVSGAADLLGGRLWAAAQRRIWPDAVLERRGDRTVDAALDWLEKDGDTPFFLWVHLFDAHGPYTPPPPYDQTWYQGDPRDPAHKGMDAVTDVAPYLRASLKGITDPDYVISQYDGEIAFADAQLGRLLAALPADTVVVVVGDHGESFGEGGIWFDHGDDVYDHSLHVPLALRAPSVAPGTRVDGIVELIDIAPTLLQLLGLPPLPGAEGRTLLQPRGNARSMCFDRAANLARRAQDPTAKPTLRLVGLRSPEALFVHHESGEDELWVGPMGQQQPMALSPDLRSVLAEQAQGLLQGDVAHSQREKSEAEAEKLRALGYMD